MWHFSAIPHCFVITLQCLESRAGWKLSPINSTAVKVEWREPVWGGTEWASFEGYQVPLRQSQWGWRNPSACPSCPTLGTWATQSWLSHSFQPAHALPVSRWQDTPAKGDGERRQAPRLPKTKGAGGSWQELLLVTNIKRRTKKRTLQKFGKKVTHAIPYENNGRQYYEKWW